MTTLHEMKPAHARPYAPSWAQVRVQVEALARRNREALGNVRAMPRLWPTPLAQEVYRCRVGAGRTII